MCIDCGCGEYNNDHGDARHITLADVEAAAAASAISIAEVGARIDHFLSPLRTAPALRKVAAILALCQAPMESLQRGEQRGES